ncbi:MAG TPA: NUDIX hydrolase, partial [Chthonomonadaceae bacterium]|nr:NUDIX hydrolase [Chthonomonadaceae bacterium]
MRRAGGWSLAYGKDVESVDLIERVVGSRQVFEGKIISLRVDTVELPNGHQSQREIVTHHGAVCIVPIQPDGTVLMVRQFRLATGRVLLEIPAGTLEAGEEPADCAARELEEETGFKPGTLRRLFHAYLSPGYSTEMVHAFAASDLQPGTVHLDAGENVRTESVPIAEIEGRILSGEIADGKTIAALLMALRT